MQSTHTSLVRAAFCAALGCATMPVAAQQNASRLSLDVVNDPFLPNDTVWRVTAGARLTTGSWCMFRFLKCFAFAGAEGRVPGTELVATAATFGNITNDKPRNLVTDLVSGLRFDLADTRGEVHGPWFVQFKVARRGMEIRSSVPIPRRNMATLAVGVDF
ncbi:MAG: hypothetical protein M3Y65_25865 [Pseudomonadota bacterium]|nr:hypothetical protein [Pseudomonadota bacterium]